MKTLTERMNMVFGETSNSHIMKNVHLGVAAYDTLCLICAELDEDLTSISDSDFDSASIALDDFISSANENSSTVSVWFDIDEN